MGDILTIIFGILIFSYTIYQIRRIYIATKKGKCVGCPSADTCAENPKNVEKVQIIDLTEE
ncbi:MAG TPA: FeoB-associated Cys-rich membrane protein [Clostridia bacterium]|nr:FeoB-associated Cys-rich membrane protein [Clostridia bacterium]